MFNSMRLLVLIFLVYFWIQTSCQNLKISKFKTQLTFQNVTNPSPPYNDPEKLGNAIWATTDNHRTKIGKLQTAEWKRLAFLCEIRGDKTCKKHWAMATPEVTAKDPSSLFTLQQRLRVLTWKALVMLSFMAVDIFFLSYYGNSYRKKK